jgi:hypothetical protein
MCRSIHTDTDESWECRQTRHCYITHRYPIRSTNRIELEELLACPGIMIPVEMTLCQNWVLARSLKSAIVRGGYTCITPAINLDHVNISLKQSPLWKSNTRSTAKNSPHFMNPEIHYHVHKSPPLDPIRSHLNSVQTLTSIYPATHAPNLLSALTSNEMLWNLDLSNFSNSQHNMVPSEHDRYHGPRSTFTLIHLTHIIKCSFSVRSLWQAMFVFRWYINYDFQTINCLSRKVMKPGHDHVVFTIIALIAV